MTDQLSHHEALIYIMVTMSAVDREMTDTELLRIGHLVKNLPVFKGFNVDDLVKTSESCGDILSREEGLDTILGSVATSLPDKLRETAYALAVEIAAVDLTVKPEEIRFLQLLRDALNLEPLIAAAIERGARARLQSL
jgi:tellurite resistance protein